MVIAATSRPEMNSRRVRRHKLASATSAARRSRCDPSCVDNGRASTTSHAHELYSLAPAALYRVIDIGLTISADT